MSITFPNDSASGMYVVHRVAVASDGGWVLQARREILRISAPDGCAELLTWLSERTSGFCGADIALLIREAFLAAVKEAYPSIYNTAVKVDIDPTVKVSAAGG